MVELLTEIEIREILETEKKKRVRVGWKVLYRDDFNLIIVKNRYYDMTYHREVWHYHYRVPEPPETEGEQVVNLYKGYLTKQGVTGIDFPECESLSKVKEDEAISGETVKDLEGSWYDEEQLVEYTKDPNEITRFTISKN